jgi:hypothetical protein
LEVGNCLQELEDFPIVLSSVTIKLLYPRNLCNSSINIYKCQNDKEDSKILLTLNMLYIFSLYNLGRILFKTNMKISRL